MKFKWLQFIIMTCKLSTYVLIIQTIFISNLFALESNAQYKSVRQAEITVGFEGEGLIEVFDKIQNKTDYHFYYNISDLNENVRLYMPPTNYKVSDILLKVSEVANLKFRQVNNSIAVSKIPPRKSKTISPDEAIVEEIVIKGKVTEENGATLPGASVIVKQTNRGVVTDVEGNYTITAPANGVLVFSFIGFKTTEVSINNRSVIDVQLPDDLTTLNEVVVTGYTQIERRRTAASTVKISEPVISRQKTINLTSRLEGISPGLLTTVENGDGGEVLSFTLRGQSTFDQRETSEDVRRDNRSPLIVLDGFPIEGGINTVNPNDIESITQLQDAAATALWGVRASNGVIIITTKKGTIGKPEFNYSYNLFIDQQPDLDQIQMASSQDIVAVTSDYIQRGLDQQVPSFGAVSLNSVRQVWANYYRDSGTLPGDPDDPAFAADRDAALARLAQNDIFRDYEDHLLRTSISHQHNFSMRGGTASHGYYFATTYNDVESNLVGDDSRRLNLLLNNNFAFGEKFEANVGFNAVFNDADFNSVGIGPLLGQLVAAESPELARYDTFFNEDGSLTDIPRGFTAQDKANFANSNPGFLDWTYNPLTELDNRDFTTQGSNYRVNLGLKYIPTDWLTLEVKGLYEINNSERRRYRSESVYSVRNTINSWITTDPQGRPVYNFPRGGILDLQETAINNYTVRGQAGIDKRFNDIHHITATVGFEVREFDREIEDQQLLGYNDQTRFQNTAVNWNDLLNVDRSFGSITNPFGLTYVNPASIAFTLNRNVSAFTSIVYTYNERYSLNVNFKRDQTSLFGVSARSRANPLWSVGANWNVTNEPFFNSEWINTLNVKFSHGVSGNISPNARAIQVIRLTPASFVPEGVIGAGLPGNPNLTHEQTAATNLSVEARLFSRLNATIEVYNRQSTDLFIPADINDTFGFSSLTLNDGEINNRGITLQLAGDVLKAGDFRWNTNFNFTYNKNEVKRYNFQGDSTARTFATSGGRPGTYFEGFPLGTRAAYRWAGLTETGGSQVFVDTDSISRFDDNIGFNGVRDLSAIAFTKPLQAPYFGGWTNSLSWRGFTLSALVVYKMGHVYRRPTNVFVANNDTYVYHEDIARRWKEEGDELNTDVPNPAFANLTQNFLSSLYYSNADIQYASASFIRLRDVTLQYNLSSALMNRLPFKGISLTAQVRNLGLIWRANDDDIDPDYIPFTGGAGFNLDRQFVLNRQSTGANKQFIFGIDIRF